MVTLLLILTTLYWSSSTPSRHQQRQIACRENLARIFMAMTIYAHSRNDRFPELPGARLSEEPLDLLIPRFTVETANFICPGAKDSPLPAGESIRNRTISYSYYMGRRAAQGGDVLMTDWQIDTLAKDGRATALFHHGAVAGKQPWQVWREPALLRWARRIKSRSGALSAGAHPRRGAAQPEVIYETTMLLWRET